MPTYEWKGGQGHGPGDSAFRSWEFSEAHGLGFVAGDTLVRHTFDAKINIVQTGSLPWTPMSNYQLATFQRRNNITGGDPSSILDLGADWLWHQQIPVLFSWSATDILSPQVHWQGHVHWDSKAQRQLQEDNVNFIVFGGFNTDFSGDMIDSVDTWYTFRTLIQHP